MKSLFNRFLDTFTVTPGGSFSARKCSAFFAVMIAAYSTGKCSTWEVIGIWLLFSVLCMGLVTTADVISFKHGKDNNNEVK